jgi:hypothetical protein
MTGHTAFGLIIPTMLRAGMVCRAARAVCYWTVAAAFLMTPASLRCAAAADDLQEFRAVKASIQRQLRSRKPDDRADAIRRLAEFPVVDAVKMALQTGFKDDAPGVRSATFETLAKLNENQEICTYLLGALSRQARRNELGVCSLPVLAALLSSKSEETNQQVAEFFDKTLEKSRGSALVITELADHLGARDEEDAVAILSKLTKTKIFANHFNVRRAVIWALIRLDRLESLGELIALAANVKGEVRGDVVKYLVAVTGQNFVDNPAAWAPWWERNKETYVLPPAAARNPFNPVVAEGTPSYYGVPIYAQRIVFVLDISGSMKGFRLAAAKRELVAAIEKLREDDEFAIVVFNSAVDVWQKRLVQATPAFKKSAAAYVNVQEARFNTASYDALEAAFNFDAEAIFFLTDGAPQGGRINSPDEIVDLITQGNRPRRESIYSIGIAVGTPNGPFDLFLRTLAEENYGTYRRVDQ